jgi:acylphosphatase
MSEDRAVSIRVIGKVQGVWFRASARTVAQTLSITGRVSNQPDGTVHIVASGNADAIQEFIAWCRQGPELARVQFVEVSETENPGYQTFEIAR